MSQGTLTAVHAGVLYPYDTECGVKVPNRCEKPGIAIEILQTFANHYGFQLNIIQEPHRTYVRMYVVGLQVLVGACETSSSNAEDQWYVHVQM